MWSGCIYPETSAAVQLQKQLRCCWCCCWCSCRCGSPDAAAVDGFAVVVATASKNSVTFSVVATSNAATDAAATALNNTNFASAVSAALAAADAAATHQVVASMSKSKTFDLQMF